MHNLSIIEGVTRLLNNKSQRSAFTARQLLFTKAPASAFVEGYLYNNEGFAQDLTKFPMMRPIYDRLPQKLLLKCSRKTLKSTLLSNIICLNMIRWNHYHMLYVAPQEASTKYFSSNYVAPRFDSPEMKKIFIKGWEKNDVYEKIFADTNSSVLFKYAKEDATRCRGPATDQNIHDEVQDMNVDILPIIAETMAMSRFKRECFAGTPLTTDNTINVLWEDHSRQHEWATKCEGCNHWNMLTMDNNPLAMIRPEGLCCSRCTKVLDTTKGEWVITNPHTNSKMMAYHLAQPIIPHFNQISTPAGRKEWDELYGKVTNGKYGTHQIFNECFGLAYDIGSKPISEQELIRLCVLGKSKDRNDNDSHTILLKNKGKYVKYTTGVDWGVNMSSSRTAAVHGALRHDGIYEVWDAKIYEGLDYMEHIKDVANLSNLVGSTILSDGGPDPIRGHTLTDMTSPQRSFLVRYGNGKLVQYYDMPSGAQDWKANRYVLHRSDCMSLIFRLLKSGKILFPDYSEMKQPMKDILAEFIEVKTDKKGTTLNNELMYGHKPTVPDDFLHALLFAVVGAYIASNDPFMHGPSTSGFESDGIND